MTWVFSLGGDKRDRTADPLLAKQVLSQLSYTPVYLGSCCASLLGTSLSCLVALRFSQNNFYSSNLFQSLRDFHSLVVIVRYFEAPSLGTSLSGP